MHGGSAKKYYLYENGMVGCSPAMVLMALKGDGTTDSRYAVVPALTFYDNSSTLLTGAAMLKIKQMQICDAHNGDTMQDFNGMYYFLSTEGKLYRFG